MNSINLFDAMNDIDNRFIVSAQSKLQYGDILINKVKKQKQITLKKAFWLIASVILLAVACLTTAFAVNKDFRQRVLEFFHVEQEHLIQNDSNFDLLNSDLLAEKEIMLGNIITGKNVHAPFATRASGGVYLVCTDELEMKQGSSYDAYYEKNGEFIKLEEQRFKMDYMIHDHNIHVEFDWVEYDGNVHITWSEANADFYKPENSGNASSVLLSFNIISKNREGKHMESQYPVLINLYTGELTDVLSQAKFGITDGLDNVFVSDDGTKMLLSQNSGDDYFLYYIDIESHRFFSVDDLSGEHADSCVIIEDRLVCWSVKDGYCKVWNINLNTYESKQLFKKSFNISENQTEGIVFISGFDNTHHWEYMYSGCKFALEIDAEQNVYVVDLLDGEKFKLADCKWTKDKKCIPNSNGTKLLLTDGPDGQDVEYVGILDFEKMCFAEFDRNNLNDVSEHLTYWFDNNTVILTSYTDYTKDFWLYRMQ